MQWVRSSTERRAIGVDLDGPTLEYAREHRLGRLRADRRARVELVQADVLDHQLPRVDVAVAFNFSYWIFKSRAEILAYFRHVHERLIADGVLFLDIFGGTEVPCVDASERDYDDYSYTWEHAAFNPITNELRCHIHFDFPDGSSLRPAFSYDWRMWTIPELRDILLEAGFSCVRVFWEREDEEGEGTGKFYQPKDADNEGVWWAYMTAEK